MNETRLALLVPRTLVKRVKTSLEERGLLDRATKIVTEEITQARCEQGQRAEIRMVIPTTLPFLHKQTPETNGNDVNEYDGSARAPLADMGLEDVRHDISITFYTHQSPNSATSNNPLLKALWAALNALPEELLSVLELSVEALVSSFPDSYSVYKPMLLLPHNAFSAAPWTKLLSTHTACSPVLHDVWKRLAAAVGATHVAVNAGIPLQNSSSSSSEDIHKDTSNENILRSPVNLTPLYGDFGPLPKPQTLANPTAFDFSSALWVSHTQNGIHQIWAPLYTMFSRGNIREKARLLTLPSVIASVSQGKSKQSSLPGSSRPLDAIKSGCTAVDLYAGIGYFAFSYKKAGISKVLCWELNPWSIEGLRRGAQKNGWTTQIFANPAGSDDKEADWAMQGADADFLVFQQSNEFALSVILDWPASVAPLPPVRHVNCGFLPSSKLCWPTAVQAIDSELGGWIHAHENVGVNDIDTRNDELVAELQDTLDRREAEKGCCGSYRKRARCEHVERVKTYAPGVLHVVFDMWIDGVKSAENLT